MSILKKFNIIKIGNNRRILNKNLVHINIDSISFNELFGGMLQINHEYILKVNGNGSNIFRKHLDDQQEFIKKIKEFEKELFFNSYRFSKKI